MKLSFLQKLKHLFLLLSIITFPIFTLLAPTPATAFNASACCSAEAGIGGCPERASQKSCPQNPAIFCDNPSINCQDTDIQTEINTGLQNIQQQSPSSGHSFEPPQCSNGSPGIQTALGCLPYEQGAFTQTFLRFAIGLAGGLALIIMLIGTITILTGGSNPEQVKKGKEIFSSAIMGLLFIIFSAVILQIITGDILKMDIEKQNFSTSPEAKKDWNAIKNIK